MLQWRELCRVMQANGQQAGHHVQCICGNDGLRVELAVVQLYRQLIYLTPSGGG